MLDMILEVSSDSMNTSTLIPMFFFFFFFFYTKTKNLLITYTEIEAGGSIKVRRNPLPRRHVGARRKLSDHKRDVSIYATLIRPKDRR